MKNRLVISSILAGLLLLLPLSAIAQRPLLYVAFATEQITVAGTAIGFTAATIQPVGGSFRANLATCSAECATTAACPFRYNSVPLVTPTASVGLIININTLTEQTNFAVYGWDNITSFKAIRSTANSVTLSCIYYR